MEPLDQKANLERVVSQKALEMGNSFPCKVCVVGFLCGICLTSLFLAALSSFGALQLDGISFSTTFSNGISTLDSSSKCESTSLLLPTLLPGGILVRRVSIAKKEGVLRLVAPQFGLDAVVADLDSRAKENERRNQYEEQTTRGIDENVQLLYYDWSKLLNQSLGGESGTLKAPHLDNCKIRVELNRRLDTRVQNERFPPWTIWEGMLDKFPLPSTNDQQQIYSRHPLASQGIYPPWVTGSDEENYPLTRKAQSDIWLHQHPSNCSHPGTRFLIADWERLPGFGIGAQIVGMSGLFSIAIKEKRVLVTSYYNRADHDGCKGSSRSSWSCYFFSETSQECRERAFELMKSKDAWERGIITSKDNYASKQIWTGRAPSVWGDPWSYMQPTTFINGSLIASHRKMDRRWWRAQAVRYLMRFRSEYTCNLLNVARHEAFGMEAAKMVLANPSAKLTENAEKSSDMEKYVWSNHQPWMPRPLLSMHVRMGDKSCEMEVFGFENYMNLAQRIRNHFPHLNTIWLSTEMQEVIDKTKLYPDWRFYYTNVSRQKGNVTMATYEARLGRETSTNYPLVNFLMATEADFFIGALGSTWCYLIDGMRNTGGKVMSGYLSVNKDRFW